MSLHTAVLGLHVAAGSAGLLLGPVLMLVPKRRGLHARLGVAYHWIFFALFLSAVGLAVLNPSVWWLGVVGAGSYALALRGYLAARRRRPGWIYAHVSGQGGSYIALVTAFLVVNWNAIAGHAGIIFAVPWILPTLIGAPLIRFTVRQIRHGRRPRSWAQASARRAGALPSAPVA
jgi:hypothetical protein